MRELISAEEVSKELMLGPNGALVYCMEFLLSNIDWLEDKLDAFIDNDCVVFDLPGQIELYTHFPFMRDLVQKLQGWDFRVQALYLLDSQFITDGAKFFGGCVTALSAMIQLEVPHINVLSKMDLASEDDKQHLEDFMYPDVNALVSQMSDQMGPRFARLNDAMANLLDQYSMVGFVPLDLTDDDSLRDLLLMIDTALQYEEEIDQNLEIADEEDDEEDDDAEDDEEDDEEANAADNDVE